MASDYSAVEIKLEKLCRTCLSADNGLISLFDVYCGSHTLDFIVANVTGLKIKRNDGLPATICNVCKKQATKAFEFKKSSEEADVSLKEIFGSIKREPTEDEDPIIVKTEESNTYEIDDSMSEDLNMPSTSGADLRELEGVRIEENRRSNFICKSCLAGFRTVEKLEVHSLFCLRDPEEPDNETLCPICGLCFDDVEMLTSHTWDEHPELMGVRRRGRRRMLNTAAILSQLYDNGFNISTLPVQMDQICCKFCKLHFDTDEQLTTHIFGHKDTKVLRCTPCKKVYLDRSKFDTHNCVQDITDSNSQDNDITVAPGINTIKYPMFLQTEIRLQDMLDPDFDMDINSLQVCHTCSCVVQTISELNKHRDEDHPELSMRCTLCAKVFASPRAATRHRGVCKKLEKRYKCNSCDLKFGYEISLNKHILKCHEGESVSVDFMNPKLKKEKKQFDCETCNKSFYTQESLAKHAKKHTSPAKTYDCDVCEKKFNRKDNLRSHKKTHEPKTGKRRTYPENCLCLYCGRSFSNSSNMLVHMRRHTGDKPYKCDICGKGFPRSSDLQCHRRTHTGEKPCVCRVCGKAFSRSNKLSRHMRVHTGQKPYKCIYCDRAFTQSNDLNLHTRRHTGDRPYICNICNEAFIQGTALQNHRRAHGHYLTPPAPPPAEAPPGAQPSAYNVQNMNNSQ